MKKPEDENLMLLPLMKAKICWLLSSCSFLYFAEIWKNII
jgi:hypothetical protein